MSVAAQGVSHSLIEYDQGDAGINRQTFSVQYTALILIVLTFILGAFIRGPEIEYPTPSQELKPLGPLTPAGSLSYGSLFQPNSSMVARGELDALITFLSNHDIKLDLALFLEAELPPTRAVELSLERSNVILRELIAAGIPPEALQVYAVEQTNVAQAEAVFVLEQDDE